MNWPDDLAAREAALDDDYRPLTLHDARLRRFDRPRRWAQTALLAAGVIVAGAVIVGGLFW